MYIFCISCIQFVYLLFCGLYIWKFNIYLIYGNKKTANQENMHVFRKTTCINCIHAYMYTSFNTLYKKFKVKNYFQVFFYQTDLSVLNIRQPNICQPFLTQFFYLLFIRCTSSFGPQSRRSLTNALLITAFTYFDPIVTGSLVAIFPKVWQST